MRFLVATDVAARGIDISGLPYVVLSFWAPFGVTFSALFGGEMDIYSLPYVVNSSFSASKSQNFWSPRGASTFQASHTWYSLDIGGPTFATKSTYWAPTCVVK